MTKPTFGSTRERRIVHQFAMYYDLQVPDDRDGRLPLIIATHGYSGNKKTMMKLARKIAPSGHVIASLQGPHQHFKQLGNPRSPSQQIGFGWLTPWKPQEALQLHHDSITRIIEELADVADSDRVVLLGFSQSVSLNLRYAMTHPERVHSVVGICGGVPFDIMENNIYHLGVVDALYVNSDADEFYPLEKIEENVEILGRALRNIDSVILKGGHTISPAMFPIIADWLRERL